ncbi:MAG: hypothetical protein R3D98_12480 [Candidatus Krumholzibacteriia bacterium]
MRLPIIALVAALAAATLVSAPAAAADTGWLLRQADLQVARVTGSLPAVQDRDTWNSTEELGGPTVGGGSRRSAAVPMLMSLVLPGAGELYLGHKRGYLQIALDAGAWYGAVHHDGKGNDLKDEYYAYADAHWAESKLAAAYDPNWSDSQPYWNPDYDYMAGDGLDYFNTPETPIDDYTDLPLWVSALDDRREYYENLGKWDQFVFGWDDYTDPRNFLGTDDINIRNLQDPRTSAHREAYRDLRQESNDNFSKRDRFIYLSIAFRLYSVLQVAYLEGLLFGGGGDDAGRPGGIEVGSHQIDFFVEPVGYARGVVGATVSF